MKQIGQKGGPRTPGTAMTASRVLDAVKDRDGIDVSEPSNYLDISKSMTYICLRTLEGDGLLAQHRDHHRFAFKFIVLGEHARSQSPPYRYGKPEVGKLTAETDQYTHIATEEDDYRVSLYQAEGDTSVDGEYQTEKVQNQNHLRYTASGRTILAALPDERVEKTIEQRGFPAQIEATVTDREAPFGELKQTRKRSYTYNGEGEIRGFRTVGAPIEDPSGQVFGSMSVPGPTSLLQGEQFREHVPKLVMQSVNIIEVSINMNAQSQSMGRGVCNVWMHFQTGIV